MIASVCAPRTLLSNESIMSRPIAFAPTFDDNHFAEVQSYSIDLLNAEETRAGSVVEILPERWGVCAPLKKNEFLAAVHQSALGSVDWNNICTTCNNKSPFCQGHVGHHELAWPLYHPGYIGTILKVLHSVCYFCSAIKREFPSNLAHSHTSQLAASTQSKNKLDTIYAWAQKATHARCFRCNAPQPIYSGAKNVDRIGVDWSAAISFLNEPEPLLNATNQDATIITRSNDNLSSYLSQPPTQLSQSSQLGERWFHRVSMLQSERCDLFFKRPFTPRDALAIFSAISSEDLLVMGFEEKTNPVRMIVQCFWVTSNVIHPAVRQSAGSKSESINDLTARLRDVMAANYEMRQQKHILLQALHGPPTKDNVLLHQHTWTCTDARGLLCYSDRIQEAISKLQAMLSEYFDLNTTAKVQSLNSGRAGAKLLGAPRSERGRLISEGAAPGVIETDGEHDARTNRTRAAKDANAAKIVILPAYKASTFGTKKKLIKLKDKIGSKRGIFRAVTRGKRVNFCIRSVITPDGRMPLDCVGLSDHFILSQPVPEIVTDYNHAWLLEKCRRGPLDVDGAHSIITDELKTIRLHGRLSPKQPLLLKVGWIVNRYLDITDVMVCNRQPTLIRQSTQALRVFRRRAMYKTVSFNTGIEPGFNGDYDGDEKTNYVMQNIDARAATKILMCAPRHMVSAKTHRMISTLTYDALIGTWLLSANESLFDRADALRILDNVMFARAILAVVADPTLLPRPAIAYPCEMWTGKQLLSLAFPSNLFYRSKQKSLKVFDPWDSQERACCVIAGQLVYGRLASNICSEQHALVYHVWKDNSPQRACNLVSDLNNMAYNCLAMRGLSVGMDDLMLGQRAALVDRVVYVSPDCPSDLRAQLAPVSLQVTMVGSNIVKHVQLTSQVCHDIHTRVVSKLKYALQSLSDFYLRNLDRLNGEQRAQMSGAAERFCNRCFDYLGRLTEAATSVDTSVMQMKTCGTKGSSLNNCQMLTLVGQQSLLGASLGRHATVNKRLLPSENYGDWSTASYGFIEHGFVMGLTPVESFQIAMCNRPDLVQSATKTSTSGYVHRKLIKTHESIHLASDRTVRNDLNRIVQYAYGGDGADALAVEKSRIFFNKFHCKSHERVATRLLQQLSGTLLGSLTRGDLLKNGFDYLTVLCPERVMARASFGWCHRLSFGTKCIGKDQFMDLLDQLCDNLREFYGAFICLDPLEVLIRQHCYFENDSFAIWRATYNEIVDAFQEMYERVVQAQAEPGEMVGHLACQSIGEHGTQMNLKTFNSSGVSSAGDIVTVTVARLEEILSFRASLRAPLMRGYLDPRWVWDAHTAELFRRHVQQVQLGDWVTHYSTVYCDLDAPIVSQPGGRLTATGRILPAHVDYDDVHAAMIDAGCRIAVCMAFTCPDIINVEGFEAIIEAMTPFLMPYQFLILLQRGGFAIASPFETNDASVGMGAALYYYQDLQLLMMQQALVRGFVDVSHVLCKPPMDVSGLNGRDPSLLDNPLDLCWTFTCSGSNLRALLSHPAVIDRTCMTNNMRVILDVFGIEGCAQAQLPEIQSILLGDSCYVQPRHAQLVTDTMTQPGHIVTINRFGVIKSDTGFLNKAAFEQTMQVLFDAALYREPDDCGGFTSRCIFGSSIPYCGTGMYDCFLQRSEHGEFLARRTASAVRDGLADAHGSTSVMPLHELLTQHYEILFSKRIK